MPLEQVTATAGRLLAPNPGPMTLEGTNTWVLRDPDSPSCIVIDPGPLDESHLQQIADLGPVDLVVLTHHHLDHTEGVERFVELTGAPVAATRESLCRDSSPLVDDSTIEAAGVTLSVISTPGHSSDSVCLLLENDAALLTGDTVLGRGTTVVAHPDGRLGDYLDSLERLRDLGDRVGTVLPGHGPVGQNPLQMLDFYLTHRRERLAQVSAAATELGPDADAMAIVKLVYADVDESVWPAAELSVRAQLDYLADSGRRR